MNPQIKRLENLLELSAQNWPSKTALEEEGRSINYEKLNKVSNLIARALKESFGESQFRAAIYYPKSIESVAILFGILKAGGTYIPLDYEAPESRNLFIIKDCAVSVIFTTSDKCPSLKKSLSGSIQDLNIDGLNQVSLLPIQTNPIQPDGLAYMLYTSGSTGKPKGVMFSHSNALHFVNWCSNQFFPDENSVFSSHASFHFDLSILDLYLSIKHGSKLILISSKESKNPLALSHLIETKKITHWYSTPTILKLMVNYGKIERHDHSSLKYVLFAGEVFPVNPLKKLTLLWSTARFFNLYGPTETNVCTYYEVKLPVDVNRIEPFPIGKICEGLKSKTITTFEGKPELYISGPNVSQGYWNNEGLNKSSFENSEGVNWYKTGDLVDQDLEGNYIYLGRKDRMVKKNGFRVELDEIENTINSNQQIIDVAVIGKINSDFECRIIAFIQINDEEGNILELKKYCLENMPHYMTPDVFVILENIPKTSTDKTDYQKLHHLNEF
ncbi:AMP-binding protein [Planktosalinus lacus]|uniref:AMP-binding protein n=1 Tax=Planktosalinus lacus TaxID=1526573 RepID=UPI0016641BC3|nr:AMP-binding protein [Planktosalinus lacus]